MIFPCFIKLATEAEAIKATMKSGEYPTSHGGKLSPESGKSHYLVIKVKVTHTPCEVFVRLPTISILSSDMGSSAAGSA